MRINRGVGRVIARCSICKGKAIARGDGGAVSIEHAEDCVMIPTHYDIAEAMAVTLEEPEAVAIMHALLAIGDSLRTLTTIAIAGGIETILHDATKEWDPENGAVEFATGSHDRHLPDESA